MIMLINAPEQSPKSLVLGIAAPEVEDRICELPFSIWIKKQNAPFLTRRYLSERTVLLMSYVLVVES